MPRRDERNRFDEDIFQVNPFRGNNPRSIYSEIRWGKQADSIERIEAPEPLVCLGTLALLKFTDNSYEEYPEREAPFLALGSKSNYLYIIIKDENDRPITVHASGYVPVGEVKQTDYYSEKGDELGYYFHKHQKPYPILYNHDNGNGILIPSKYKGSKRSYAVIKEGIVG